MKQINLTILLTILMSIIGVKAYAHDIEVNNADGVTIYYKWTNNKTELAVSYRGSRFNSYSNEYTGNVVIYESVIYEGKAYNVTSIDKHAFSCCSDLMSVNIPNSVTSIGEHAFDACYGLISVNIPNSVTSIGNCAFYGCSSLTSIT